jgi:hypothetical protein
MHTIFGEHLLPQLLLLLRHHEGPGQLPWLRRPARAPVNDVLLLLLLLQERDDGDFGNHH